MVTKFESLGTPLSRDEAKKIKGGTRYTCYAQVNGQINAYLNTSLSEAANQASSAATGHWCCNSCSSAKWLKGVVSFGKKP